MDLKNIDISRLVSVTKGYSEVDIGGVIKERIETVFFDGKKELTTKEILKTIENTHFLSEIMKESLDKMKQEYENPKFKNSARYGHE